MADDAVTREEQLAVRERAVARARAELRAERARVELDRADVDRLLIEASAARHDATRERSRARRLAGRFAARLEQRNKAAEQSVARAAEALARDRAQFASDVAQFNATRSEFHTSAAVARDRLREAWHAVEARQQQTADGWAEANRYFDEQTAALDQRTASLESRETAAAARLAQAQADAAGLGEEATTLELRVRNARAALAEIERRRDRIRAEVLRAELPPDLAPKSPPADLSQQDLLIERERASLAAVRSSLARESADLDDRRRLVAEQLSQLAEARARWQRAERQTLIDMEELARGLRHKEQELDAREQRLIRADARRREDSHDLWRLRLHLEAWQSKLTAFELRWHTDREQLEADLELRLTTVARREAALAATAARWEQARAADHARLRAELEYWAADRQRLARVAAEFERLQETYIAELATYATHTMAAEQLVGEALKGSGTEQTTRRLVALRKRWERVFDRKVREVDARRTAAAAEQVAVEQRYRSLHEQLLLVMQQAVATVPESAPVAPTREETAGALPPRREAPPAPSAELVALRAEVERLAVVMLQIEAPEPLDAPEPPIPWAVEEPEPASLLRFSNDESQAA